jgi:hypothetical protein
MGGYGKAPEVPNDLVRNAQRWRDAGATHVCVDTMGSELTELEAHLDALANAADALQLGSALHDRPAGHPRRLSVTENSTRPIEGRSS